MFIAALVIYFKPGLVIIDPICTFVFSLLVLATTISILREGFDKMLHNEWNFPFNYLKVGKLLP